MEELPKNLLEDGIDSKIFQKKYFQILIYV